MPKYRVTYLEPSTVVVEAENPYMAAVSVGGQVLDVRAARGPRVEKAPAKKKRVISPEGRAAMAANAARARAAKAKKKR